MKITITIECELDGELSNPGELGELLMDRLSGAWTQEEVNGGKAVARAQQVGEEVALRDDKRSAVDVERDV